MLEELEELSDKYRLPSGRSRARSVPWVRKSGARTQHPRAVVESAGYKAMVPLYGPRLIIGATTGRYRQETKPFASARALIAQKRTPNRHIIAAVDGNGRVLAANNQLGLGICRD